RQSGRDAEEDEDGQVVRKHQNLVTRAAPSSSPRILQDLENISGADGETRTLTPCGASPSSWCVYQFHHVRMNQKRHAQSSPGCVTAAAAHLRSAVHSPAPRPAARAREPAQCPKVPPAPTRANPWAWPEPVHPKPASRSAGTSAPPWALRSSCPCTRARG